MTGRVDPIKASHTYSCFVKNGKSIRATSTAIGMSRDAVKRHVAQHEESLRTGGIEFPDFPASDIPVADIISQMKTRCSLRRASYAAHTWFPVNVSDDAPIGVLWFGDPHLDDDGCDWNILDRHIDLCRRPGMYGVNIGDTTNNWAGRLVRKYADQETSSKTASRLAEWFMLDSGVRWLAFLLGNHDAWGDGAAILSEMAKRHGTQKLVLHDWESRFSLNFRNGKKANIWAAHDFPGDSQWNPLHGPVKAARFGPDVDLLVCGHKHNWGISQWELADKGTCPLMIRVRGYKFNDDYARHIGKTEQDGGSSILTIFNQHSATRGGFITAFADIESGCNYLKFLRGENHLMKISGEAA